MPFTNAVVGMFHFLAHGETATPEAFTAFVIHCLDISMIIIYEYNESILLYN